MTASVVLLSVDSNLSSCFPSVLPVLLIIIPSVYIYSSGAENIPEQQRNCKVKHLKTAKFTDAWEECITSFSWGRKAKVFYEEEHCPLCFGPFLFYYHTVVYASVCHCQAAENFDEEEWYWLSRFQPGQEQVRLYIIIIIIQTERHNWHSEFCCETFWTDLLFPNLCQGHNLTYASI